MTSDESTDDNTTLAAGIPMSLEEMRLHLQSHYARPVALREADTVLAKCPYTDTLLHTPPGPGYFRPDPGLYGQDFTPEQGVVIHDRYFTPNYGFVIIEYRLKDDTYHIVE